MGPEAREARGQRSERPASARPRVALLPGLGCPRSLALLNGVLRGTEAGAAYFHSRGKIFVRGTPGQASSGDGAQKTAVPCLLPESLGGHVLSCSLVSLSLSSLLSMSSLPLLLLRTASRGPSKEAPDTLSPCLRLQQATDPGPRSPRDNSPHRLSEWPSLHRPGAPSCSFGSRRPGAQGRWLWLLPGQGWQPQEASEATSTLSSETTGCSPTWGQALVGLEGKQQGGQRVLISLLRELPTAPCPGPRPPDSHPGPTQGTSSTPGLGGPALTAPGSAGSQACPPGEPLGLTCWRLAQELSLPPSPQPRPLSRSQGTNLSPIMAPLCVWAHSGGAGCLPGVSGYQGGSCSHPSPPAWSASRGPRKLTRAGGQHWGPLGGSGEGDGQPWALTQSLLRGSPAAEARADSPHVSPACTQAVPPAGARATVLRQQPLRPNPQWGSHPDRPGLPLDLENSWSPGRSHLLRFHTVVIED